MNKIKIREATKSDQHFIFSLSPILSEVADLSWHTDEVILKSHDDYIAEMLAEASVPTLTLIAEIESKPCGFIHMRTRKDETSRELAVTIPLLAILPEAQGFGLGPVLIEKAKAWGRKLGCRLLHLEVYANNKKAQRFYHQIGFKEEMIHMVKEI